MPFLVISVSVFVFIFALIVMRGPLQKQRIKKRQLDEMTNRISLWDEDLRKNFWDRIILPLIKDITKKIRKKAKSGKQKKQKKDTSSKMDESLRQAGFSISSSEFAIFRMAVIIASFILGWIISGILTSDEAIRFLIIFLISTAAVAGPVFGLRARVKARTQEMKNQMPDVMDILSVSIEAGLGFDAALNKVIERFEGPLIEELAVVYREVRMGMSRRESLRALAKRCPLDELQTFATSVIQSEQYGTPMKNVLHQQSKQLRVARKQAAQEKGMKAPVRILIPMVIFIFPVIFIILLGPTIITTIEQFR